MDVPWSAPNDLGTFLAMVNQIPPMGDEDPPKIYRVVWGLGEGVVAAALLLAGGLAALQTASIAAAFPISFVLIAMMMGLIKSLREDSSAVFSRGHKHHPIRCRAARTVETLKKMSQANHRVFRCL